MTPVQDIDVATNNRKSMRVVLRSQNSGFFVSLQELIKDGSFAGIYSEFSSPLHQFNDANTAFEYAIKSLKLFLSYSQDNITAVNNPCNCELLSLENQQSVLSGICLTITPTVNE